MAKVWKYLRRHWMLYAMLIPGLAYIIIFKYIPMYGLSIAFKDYEGIGDIANAQWVGWENFTKLFSKAAFIRSFKNTVIISFAKILFGFPAPIILALFIDSLRKKGLKKLVQTSVILPNFISWVVIYGLMYAILGPSSGVISEILTFFGFEGKIPDLLSSKEYFREVIVGSYIWKSAGIGTIVYLAALTGIDPQLYEAAAIDGAGPWRKTWHISLAGLRTTIIVMLIFRVGEMMHAGFDHIYAISNNAVISVADIIDTYIYRVGLEQGNFSLATAAGFIQSIIGLVMVLITNYVAKKVDPDSGIM
ncbi:MAG: sugar ABC transporter permease [Lachnospiraceae bacterium]|nr:sugar ABC transporter permease [Lachnospiraceae bacterium]